MAKKFILFVLAFAMVFSFAVTAHAEEDNGDLTPEAFSCYTYDGKDNPLNGYWSEEDDIWYLFVTSTQSIGDMVLHYTGDITEVSAGQLDAETQTVTGAFTNSGDQLEMTATDDSVYTVVIMQSNLTSVHITLEGTTLDEIHLDKDTKHKGNSIYIMDPNGTYDLTVEGSLEIKGRGNSTWREYEKKAYQIKFDSKTSVMGMGKAKKWVLLANASDDSMIRTQLVYNMASKLGMDFVPQLKYIDLWIDGDYRGTFLIGEKVEPGSSRLNLTNDAGALFEHDEAFYIEEDYWFYSTMLQKHFVMKEIVEEDDAIIADAMADFEEAVDQLASYLYSTPSYQVTLEELSTMIDVDSFVKYYLINEYVQNCESFATSFYWYKDGPDDVIHLGPIWDFDTCMGNDGTAYTSSYGHNHILFRYLLAIPEFYERTLELWDVYKSEFAAMTENADSIQAEIAASAEMNYLRWDVLGEPNPKGGSDFYPSFNEAVAAVKNWLNGRETAFSVTKSVAVTSVVSDDCYNMEINFQDGNEHSKVEFAVWSLDAGQDDERWYAATKNENGDWVCNVNLSKHNSAGMYRIDVYLDDSTVATATGFNYVEIAREPLYPIHAEVSDDGRTMTLTVKSPEACTDVTFAIWDEENNQDSVRWFDAVLEDAEWIAEVPMCIYDKIGTYQVHAYSTLDGQQNFFADTTVGIETILEHTYADQYDTICAVCGHELASVPMYRLYDPNSGEHFYTGSTEERDILVNVGWYYEGVGFNFPIVGEPVYRLYDPVTGEHLYTMDQDEIATLLAAGWNNEGVAFNSAATQEIPQYRLHNPNAERGAYHFTSSDDEKNHLISIDWEDQGIGWYSCLK